MKSTDARPVAEGTDQEPERQPLFPHYSPSDRHSVEPIKYVRQAGWLTIVLTALFMWAEFGNAPPVYWSIMGVAFGALILLRGALELRQSDQQRFRWSQQLARSLDRWFPYLLFTLQTLFMFLLVAVLWFILPVLGVYLHPALHIGMFSLLVLIAIRRLIGEWARHKGAEIRLPVQDALQYVTTIIVTLLVAIALTHAISPFGHPITGDNTMPIVIIWVIASFVILCCIILFIDRLFVKRQR